MRPAVRIVALTVLALAATLAGRAVGRSQAGDDGGPLAGSFAAEGREFLTHCTNTNSGGCRATMPTLAPSNAVTVGQGTIGAGGTFCGTFISTTAEVAGTAAPAIDAARVVSGRITFDPITGQGDAEFSVYLGGGCHGPQFLGTGATLVATGTAHGVASNGGDRIDAVVASYNKLAGNTAGVVVTMTMTRQRH